MWVSNHCKLIWISCILVTWNIVYAQRLNNNLVLRESTVDFLENEESGVVFLPRQIPLSNLEYEVENEGSARETTMEDGNNNLTQSRINLNFLFGGNPFRSTRRIPTVDNNRRNGISSQEYENNPYLWSTTKNNNIIERTTRKTTSKKPNNKQSQWTNTGGNRQEINGVSNPVQPDWQSPSVASWEQPNSFNGGFSNGQSQNNNGQGSFPQQNWGSSFGNPNNWEVPSTKPTGNNQWQSPSNGWANEDKPTWGIQPRPTTTRRPSTTTKRANSNSWDDQQPVWTERTTTQGRYRPSPTRKPQKKSISELKCDEYSKPYTQTINALPLSLDPEVVSLSVGKCDRNAQALIVGGQKSELGEFPHMAAVGFRTKRGVSWNCGGSLISETFVVTAAHCTDSSLGKPVAVRLGELNLVRNDDGANPENYKVVQVYAHPDYSSSKKYNDIALLRLDRSVEFTDNVRPACLHNGETIGINRALATGWGAIGFGDRSSDVLLKVGLGFIENNKCAALYRSEQSSSLNKGIIESQLCAGELDGGYDTCLGDSGGPLQVTSDTNKCIYKIVGVTSFGKFCGEKNSPGVYTRVSSFVPWIESIVWP
uniref:Serine protease snake n=2 Tax=Cacopsylla melanoneura TaxID=428564 RepID=A0A8D8RL55_9HEMI